MKSLLTSLLTTVLRGVRVIEMNIDDQADGEDRVIRKKLRILQGIAGLADRVGKGAILAGKMTL
jgi:hypothetical protein